MTYRPFVYCQDGEQKGIGATRHHIGDIVVDSGVGFDRVNGRNVQYAPGGNWLYGQHIETSIYTHDHMDHLGTAPRFVAEHPETSVLMSSKAFEAGTILLKDSLKIMESDARADRRSHRQSPEMIFTETELEQFLNHPNVDLVDGPEWFERPDGVKIGLYPAGHNPGAMSVFIITADGRPIWFTGDISSHDQEIVSGVMLPDPDFLNKYDFIKRPGLVLVTEATNGNRPQIQPRGDIKRDMFRTLRQIEARGGVALYPVFGRNRAGNVASMLMEGDEKGPIVPHVDGMARKMLPLEIPNLEQLIREKKIIFIEQGTDQTSRDNAAKHRYLLDHGADPCNVGFSPILAPSADLSKGYAVEHAIEILPGPNNAVISTGHRFEGSNIKEIFEIERGRTISLEKFVKRETVKVPVDVRCDKFHFDFTGHDYQGALVDRIVAVQDMLPANAAMDVVVHHCQEDSFHGLQAAVVRRKGLKGPNIHWGQYGREITIE